VPEDTPSLPTLSTGRPTRNPPPSQVIDLTDSPRLAPVQRPPTTTGPREVIDLDLEPDPLPLPHHQFHHGHRPRRPRTQRPPRRPMYQPLPGEDITRTQDVIILGDTPPPHRPSFSETFYTTIRDYVLNSLPQQTQIQELHIHHHHSRPAPPQGPSAAGFVPPRRLNYGQTPAHILNHFPSDGPLADYPPFKDVNYTAPPPAKGGFTRSPQEGMTLVCPDCGVELGTNTDVKKKEVWIGKCGHVYCGECAERQKMNKGRGARVGRCCVEGCTRIISGDKAMIRICL